MKDKVISLDTGEDYYIFEELDYNDRKFALGAKCDLDKDTLNDEELEVLEISVNDGELVIIEVSDDDLARDVTERILSKIRNS